MNTELERQNLPQQVHLFTCHSQIHQWSICRRSIWKELASTFTALGKQKGGKAAARTLQQLPPIYPHFMILTSTTFESQRLRTVLTLQSQLLNSHLFITNSSQMGSNFTKKPQTNKEPTRGEKTVNLLLHKWQFKHLHHLPINLHPPKGGSAHPEGPPTNTKWLIYIKH